MRLILILSVSLLAFWVSSCESKEQSAKVLTCEQACEQSPVLRQLNSKVVYKPIKLCKKRCRQTKGTCSEKEAQWSNLQQCIFFGVNAGRPPGTTGPLLR